MVIFTSGKKHKMMADFFAGQMVEDGRSIPIYSNYFFLILSLSLGHKVG